METEPGYIIKDMIPPANIQYTNNVEEAEKLNIVDTSSLICCSIDMACQAFVPEVYGEVSDSDIDALALRLTNSMFSNNTGVIPELIKEGIRKNKDELFYQLPEGYPETTNGYMSVWEWLARITAKN